MQSRRYEDKSLRFQGCSERQGTLCVINECGFATSGDLYENSYYGGYA
ncbi:MAG: hypothetical protein L3J43_03060 [Sulfurovum sp.]|nr:hypothetical protein [Sulfurovum sp.]